MVITLGLALPGSMSKALSRKQKSRSTSSISGCLAFGCVIHRPYRPIAICTISSACGWYMKVPGRRAELVDDEGLARRDAGLRQAGDAVHAVGQALAVPVHAVCSGSLLVTKMRTRSPSTTSMVGPGLWPFSPQARLEAGRHLAQHRLGDKGGIP